MSNKKYIYIYKVDDSENNQTYKGWIKIGETTKQPDERVNEQSHGQVRIKLQLLWWTEAVGQEGQIISDHDVHNLLDRNLIQWSKKDRELKETMGSEWFKTQWDTAKLGIESLLNKTKFSPNRTTNFKPRKEQSECIKETKKWFTQNPSKPKFLWNCKMRFGKTMTTYWLAKEMKLKKILITTFKPAVKDSWETDLLNHMDFDVWEYIDRNYSIEERKQLLKSKNNIVCFASLQDLLGRNQNQKIKDVNKIIHETEWDLVVFDEYHYGAWREQATVTFNPEEFEEKIFQEQDKLTGDDTEKEDMAELSKQDAIKEKELFPIHTKYKLYLSGTPFRAVNQGEFLEAQIYTWTYEQEQEAKKIHENLGNKSPYCELPQMIIATYKLTPKIKGIHINDAKFSLNKFFDSKCQEITKNGKNEKLYSFKNQESVVNWLEMMTYKLSPLSVDDERRGANRPVMPFGGFDTKNNLNFKEELKHTMWLLKDIGSCEAMFSLLNTHKHLLPNYKIVRCYGHHCGCGADALIPVRTAITDNPSKTKTIILTCGKLTTGVTIKELNGVLMLCDCNSSEKYMQSAFRCQSPWYTLNPDGTKTIFKDKCYIIDFMPNRTLQQVKTYSIQLNTNKNKSQTQKVDNFIRYLPIFSFDGMVMKQLTPDELIQIVLLGFDVTNLAKRFYEHRLINMNDDLINLVNGNKDIERILNKIDVFRKFGKESMREIAAQIGETNKDISDLEEKNLKTTDKNKKAQISAELKEKLKLKQQARFKMKDKLGTFLAKIPIFMYLNNWREEKLEDVIRYVETDLFEKVTGLTIEDFETLNRYGFFDVALLDDTVLLFRVFEEPSLKYLGIVRNANREYGLFSKTISEADFNEIKNDLRRD